MRLVPPRKSGADAYAAKTLISMYVLWRSAITVFMIEAYHEHSWHVKKLCRRGSPFSPGKTAGCSRGEDEGMQIRPGSISTLRVRCDENVFKRDSFVYPQAYTSS